jgi:hypothetical protein
VALACDRHLFAGFVETGEQSDDRRRRPLGDLAAMAFADQQHRELRPQFYDKATAAIIDRGTGRITGGNRYNGSCYPAAASKATARTSSWPATRRCSRCSAGQPVGFSKTHYDAFEPRLGLAYSDQRPDCPPCQRRRLP